MKFTLVIPCMVLTRSDDLPLHRQDEAKPLDTSIHFEVEAESRVDAIHKVEDLMTTAFANPGPS